MHDSPENRPLPVVVETPFKIDLPDGETGTLYKEIGQLIPQVSNVAKACLSQDKKFAAGYESIFGKKDDVDPSLN